MIIRHRVTTVAEQRRTMGAPNPSILRATSRGDTKLDELDLVDFLIVDTTAVDHQHLIIGHRVRRGAVVWGPAPSTRSAGRCDLSG